MELLEGEDLRSLITREGPLSVQRTADLMIPVVSAVAAAHELGVVHRDLKPDNIFLSTERSSITPKVLDFGISKVADPEKAASLTGTGTLLGTPYYMSPEQAQTEKNIDARSDQYSLGVIMYECVTGRRPIEEPALYQLIQRIVHGDFPAPRQLNPNITAPFEQLILQAMARDPGSRFPTTRALGRALLGFASERVRANYADEFAVDALPQKPGSISTPPEVIAGLGTTLRESVHERDSSGRPAPPRRSKSLLVGGAVVVVGIGLAIAGKLAQTSYGEGPAEDVRIASGAAAVPAPALPSAPAPVAASPSASADAGASPDAPAAPAPSAGASVASSASPATPPTASAKPVKRRAPPASDRPALAPR
jgi:serine/threonine-protein kinase